jgi:hypothetical protein
MCHRQKPSVMQRTSKHARPPRRPECATCNAVPRLTTQPNFTSLDPPDANNTDPKPPGDTCSYIACWAVGARTLQNQTAQRVRRPVQTCGRQHTAVNAFNLRNNRLLSLATQSLQQAKIHMACCLYTKAGYGPHLDKHDSIVWAHNAWSLLQQVNNKSTQC